ncbi:hypothetical protein [Paludibaculum fermentans]|uniref:hypothetical protein n=1 Tax=Paludibaculum fermentans TaxID=1473598 RepID=UPI003EB7933B
MRVAQHVSVPVFIALLLAGLPPARSFAASPQDSGPGAVLRSLSIAQFESDNPGVIQAIASDAAGNVYAAGRTISPNFKLENPFQIGLGESTGMRSLDMGLTWKRLGIPPDAIQMILPDPVDPNVLFAAGDQVIFKSSDAGESWKVVVARNKEPGNPFYLQPVVDRGNSQRLAVAVGKGILLRSFDRGETWAEAACPLYNCGTVADDPSGAGRLLAYSAGQADIYLSPDWGQSFQRVATPQSANPLVRAASLDPAHPGWIYAVTDSFTQSELWLSKDSGASWIRRTLPLDPYNSVSAFVPDIERADTWYIVSLSDLYRTEDGGATWVPVRYKTSGSFALPSHQCGSGGGLVAITGSGTVAASSDLGASWGPDRLYGFSRISAGPDCAIYGTKTFSGDAFLVKIARDGSVVWSTLLAGAMDEWVTALKLDAHGDIAVLGFTRSPDFPRTAPHVGVAGERDLFVARFSNSGQLLGAVTVGGQSDEQPVALDIGPHCDAYVAGITASSDFPVTPDALNTRTTTSMRGFVLRINAEGVLQWATYFGDTITPFPGIEFSGPSAVLAGADGQVWIGGIGILPGTELPPETEAGYLARLAADGTRLNAYRYLGGPVSLSHMVNYGPRALATDSQGYLYVGGTTRSGAFPRTAGALDRGVAVGQCWSAYQLSSSTPAQQIYLMKLMPDNLEPVYSALLGGHCDTQFGSLAVDEQGVAGFSVSTGQGFPLSAPLQAAPSIADPVSIPAARLVARLSSDGSSLLFSSYLDASSALPAPSIANAPEGGLYAAVQRGSQQRVLQLPSAVTAALTLDRVSNSFSGDGAGVTANSIYTLDVRGLDAETTDSGLNPAQGLPTEQAGVRVTFDGVSVPILSTTSGRVTVVSPNELDQFTAIQVSYQGHQSNIVFLPVLPEGAPTLATRDYSSEGVPPFAGVIYNEDGTTNDAEHPARPGSTILALVSGVSIAGSAPVPGAIHASDASWPTRLFYYSWGKLPLQVQVRPLPGFLTAIYQLVLTVPDSPEPGVLQAFPLTVSGYNIVRNNLFAFIPFGTNPYGILPSAVSVYVK